MIRLSGAGVREAIQAIAGRLPPPRVATLTEFAAPSEDGKPGEVIDRGLLLWFPAPFSYTGEDGAELQLHGGRATVAAAAEALGRLGLRAAEPGEFTRRAFHNHKLDLTQAEAIADLTDAETAAQRKQALRQLEGQFGERVEGWRVRLIAAMAVIEATLDFSDEDLPDGVEARARSDLLLLRDDISAFLGQPSGERLREGVRVAIIGPPNAGKSSLLNALAQREAAIVSAIAGTTRDVIEVHLDLGGIPAVVADTAGLREATDLIEAEGIRRATEWAKGADLRVLVAAADDWKGVYAPEVRSATTGTHPALLVVGNKVDQAPTPPFLDGRPVLPVSVTSGEGMDLLVEQLTAEAGRLVGVGEAPTLTRARHREALTVCIESIDRALNETEIELRAEQLRISSQALSRITGRIEVEDVLDVLFRTFCIGK